jgi:hypothetical protein
MIIKVNNSGYIPFPIPPIGAPTLLVASTVSKDTIYLTWIDNSSDEDGFTIERGLDGINFTQIDTVVPGSESYYDGTANTLNTRYYYRVRAYKGTSYSIYSNTASDWTPMELVVTSNGTGLDTTSLAFECIDTSINITVDGNGKFYTDGAGTLNQSSTWVLNPGGLTTRYVKVTAGASNMLIYHKNNLTNWGKYTYPGEGYQPGFNQTTSNSPSLTFDFSGLAPSLIEIGIVTNSGTVTGDLSDLPSNLISLNIGGSAITLTGDLSDLSDTVRYFNCYANNTISGNVVDIPSSAYYFNVQGTNTITGDIENLPGSNLEFLQIRGVNTISGDVADIPQGLLQKIIIYGINTLTGDIAGLDYASPVLSQIYIVGNNTISGDISDIPSSIVVIDIEGGNTISGTNWSNTVVNAYITGSNTISSNITNLPSSIAYFTCAGVNTISGDLGSLPISTITFNVTGNNTITGDVKNLQEGLLIFIVEGTNTITGAISDLPASLTDIRVGGQNTISGAISDFQANMMAIVLGGKNTLSGDIDDMPSNVYIFQITGNNTIDTYTLGHTFRSLFEYLICVPIAGGGLSSAEVDNLLIDFNSDVVTITFLTPAVTLTGTNAARTAASNAAVASLITKNYVVTTN